MPHKKASFVIITKEALLIKIILVFQLLSHNCLSVASNYVKPQSIVKDNIDKKNITYLDLFGDKTI
jgi:hypothetical protein